MGHTSTYDPKLRCIYVFGGSKNLQWFHDVHMLDVDEWKWQLLKVLKKTPLFIGTPPLFIFIFYASGLKG